MKKRITKRLLVIVAILISLFWFSHWQNNSLVTTEVALHSERLPLNFSAYRIVQLSDLHNKRFGSEQQALVQKVADARPDLIVFTGDLVDSAKGDEEASLLLMEKLVELAPVYYVTGNHEWSSGRFSSLEQQLTAADVHILRNTASELAIGEDTIQLVGIDDPAQGEQTENMLEQAFLTIADEPFTILLAHRPEEFARYADYPVDLIFSGHAHGGQFRLPFGGGLVAPNQGWFPAYTAGTHTMGRATMIVNRGLGNSIIPQRIFNRPEVVVVTLRKTA
ncbi:metallophosphoesterase [Alkalihalobacillus oceani]|uniref:metallophosphoesterase n=1 Tax=Halalkalibacter oceani TaxID=1653776 RepID=UPI00203CABD2|nr:metallophosphoesterase [Halalkalibacter oceani]MCM3762043.1 metallophosphoesterase [Halalkalibacter oceani]